MKTFSHLFISCAAAACAHSAQAFNVAYGSVSITDMQYELVDLDTADGITPWVRFEGNSFLVGATDYYFGGETFTRADGNLFTDATGATTSTNGSLWARYDNTGIYLGMEADSNQVQNLGWTATDDTPGMESIERLTTARVVNQFGTSDQPTYAFAGFPGSEGQSSFTLSPNTQLILSAQFAIELGVEANQVGEGALRQGVDGGQYEALFSASGSMGLYAFGTNGDQLAGFAVGELAQQRLTVQGVQPSTLPFDPFVDVHESFSLTINNSSAGELVGGLVVDTAISDSVTLIRVTTAVPETGTWALMGLGLMSLIAARRHPHL